MKLKLEKLTLHNFKGCREFVLDTQGGISANLHGDNATFKTTVFDAFTWLLFDKNSQDKADFEVKTLQKDGEPLHGLDHSVEAVLSVNEYMVILKKVYREKWVKKTGSVNKQFTGHETDHSVDGVPVKKSEYMEKVNSLIPEDTFKLLTNPKYFNEQLHWEKRRELLLNVCGDITDADVIASNDKLSTLPDILGTRALEDHRKVIAARRAEINKELVSIPIRIDELSRSITEPEIPITEALAQYDKIKMHIDTQHNQLATLTAGGAIAEKTKELRLLEADLIELRNAGKDNVEEKRRAVRQQLATIEDSMTRDKRHKATWEAAIEEELTRQADNERKIKTSQDDITLVMHREEMTDTKLTCPTCNQSLPADQVEVARAKALADTNKQRSEEIEKLRAAITGYESRLLEAKEEEDGARKLLSDVIQSIVVRIEEQHKLQQELEQIVAAPLPDTCIVTEQIEKVKTEIEKLRVSNIDAEADLHKQLGESNERACKLSDIIAQERANKQAVDRINELKVRERTLAAEYEKLEHELYLTDEFVKTKVKLLDEKINSRFKYAEFKLFNELVNGGIEPTCITTYRGVPYNSLNNGARINIGLDIINTLAEHYGIEAVIFVDQREAVTKLIPVNSQIISLIVSAEDPVLRVEIL